MSPARRLDVATEIVACVETLGYQAFGCCVSCQATEAHFVRIGVGGEYSETRSLMLCSACYTQLRHTIMVHHSETEPQGGGYTEMTRGVEG